jgi:hypothetical protein
VERLNVSALRRFRRRGFVRNVNFRLQTNYRYKILLAIESHLKIVALRPFIEHYKLSSGGGDIVIVLLRVGTRA